MAENVLCVKSEDFAVRIVNAYKCLHFERKEHVCSKQLLRSGTSIGANVAEAQCAQSDSDFLSKMQIAFKECNETLYWLRKNKNKSMIIEYLFCSNRKDVSLYNPQKLANACIYGLTNSYPITTDKLPVINNNPTSNTYSNGTYQCKGKVINTNGEGLNIRAERNANSKIIGKLKEGYIVKVDYCLNNWFSVWENGKLGYINGKYIELVK